MQNHDKRTGQLQGMFLLDCENNVEERADTRGCGT
jgi:hypothetical protein